MDIDTLSRIPLFSSVPSTSLEKILDISIKKSYQKDTILYYENDKENFIYYLLSGSVKIFKVDRLDNEVFLYNVGKNSFISELTSFDSIGCFASAIFLEDSEVLKIDYERFRQVLRGDCILLERVFEAFIKQVKSLQCIINREIVFDGSAKVAHLLDTDLDFFNSSKRQDIAHLLNIQPETLSRILKKLTREEVIDTKSSDIKIVDQDKLREIYR